MQALTRAARSTALLRQAGQVRRMSGSLSLEEEVKQMSLWKSVTILAVPGCIGLAFYMLSHEEHHGDHKVEREYTNIRSKSFPWGECALFDRKCKAAKKAAGVEE